MQKNIKMEENKCVLGMKIQKDQRVRWCGKFNKVYRCDSLKIICNDQEDKNTHAKKMRNEEQRNDELLKKKDKRKE